MVTIILSISFIVYVVFGIFFVADTAEKIWSMNKNNKVQSFIENVTAGPNTRIFTTLLLEWVEYIACVVFWPVLAVWQKFNKRG